MNNGTAQLTELEATKLENFALKHTSLQQSIRENLAARNQYIEQVVAAHPGYEWQENKGGLVAIPPPPPPEPQKHRPQAVK